MINKGMARDYLQRAKWCLEEALLARDREDYAGVARQSQEALELAAINSSRQPTFAYQPAILPETEAGGRLILAGAPNPERRPRGGYFKTLLTHPTLSKSKSLE